MSAEQPDLEKMKKAKIPTRRAKMLRVEPADFMFLFTKGLLWRKNTRLVAGVPDDAEILTIAADPLRHAIFIVVKSSTYEPIPIEQIPPIELVEIQTGRVGATKKKPAPRKKR